MNCCTNSTSLAPPSSTTSLKSLETSWCFQILIGLQKAVGAEKTCICCIILMVVGEGIAEQSRQIAFSNCDKIGVDLPVNFYDFDFPWAVWNVVLLTAPLSLELRFWETRGHLTLQNLVLVHSKTRSPCLLHLMNCRSGRNGINLSDQRGQK